MSGLWPILSEPPSYPSSQGGSRGEGSMQAAYQEEEIWTSVEGVLRQRVSEEKIISVLM
jgi:hypothetical protein